MEWKSKLEEYPKHTQAIGMISIENANLETALADLFSTALSIAPRIGHAIYLTPKSSIARLEILQSAVTIGLTPSKRLSIKNPTHAKKQETALKKVLRITERAKTATGKRHGIIHDAWGAEQGSEEISRYPIVATYEGKTGKPVPIKELEQLTKEFRALIGDAIDLATEFREHPPTLISMAINALAAPPDKIPQQNPGRQP